MVNTRSGDKARTFALPEGNGSETKPPLAKKEQRRKVSKRYATQHNVVDETINGSFTRSMMSKSDGTDLKLKNNTSTAQKPSQHQTEKALSNAYYTLSASKRSNSKYMMGEAKRQNNFVSKDSLLSPGPADYNTSRFNKS